MRSLIRRTTDGERWTVVDVDDNRSALTRRAQSSSEASEVDRVYDGVRDEIMSGALPAGHRLSERNISEQYGVSSRVPVREALRRLKSEGLVDQQFRRRARVHGLSAREIANLGEMHLAFDSLALRQAAERRTPEDLETLRARLDDCLAVDPEAEPGELLRRGGIFRHAVFDAAHDEILDEVYYLLEGRIELLFRGSVGLPQSTWIYEQIFDAVLRGDAEAGVRSFVEYSTRWQELWHARSLDRLADDLQNLPAEGRAVRAEIEASQEGEPADVPHYVSIADTLRSQILSGERAPGTVLAERSISVEFDVSRYPVRQAIEMLTAEGLVAESSRRSASKVRSIHEFDGDDLLDVCGTLDAFAARLAAERASDAHVARMRRIVLAEEQLLRRGQGSGLLDLAFEWRAVLHAMSENELILDIDRILNARLRLLVVELPFAYELIRAHRLILEAVEARNPVLAEAVLPNLLSSVGQEITASPQSSSPTADR